MGFIRRTQLRSRGLGLPFISDSTRNILGSLSVGGFRVGNNGASADPSKDNFRLRLLSRSSKLFMEFFGSGNLNIIGGEGVSCSSMLLCQNLSIKSFLP